MGNQGTAESGLRRGCEVLRSGAIGAINEVHVWSNRPIWPQGIERPSGSDPIPPYLDWDLWLGPAPERPYKGGNEFARLVVTGPANAPKNTSRPPKEWISGH